MFQVLIDGKLTLSTLLIESVCHPSRKKKKIERHISL